MKEIKNNENKKEILLTNPTKRIIGNITKKDIFNYYKKIAPSMMPYLENRIISVMRAPSGINNNKFFKKHLENQNGCLEKINISTKNNNDKDYYYILDEIALLSEVQMNSYEFHIWGSNASNKNRPNIMVFDLDPDEKLSLNKLRLGVKYLKKVLDNLNLKSFLKTSGGKGYHVCIPFKNNLTWKKFYKISEDIANILENTYPEIFTTNIRKENRKGKIFIDYFRNQKSATFVAPYSIRLRKSAPISMPISWNELDKIKPNEITIDNVIKRTNKKDPWKDFFTSN